MRVFEVRAPDGRHIHQEHESHATAVKKLVQGYEIVGEVLASSELSFGSANGVTVRPPLGDGLPSYAFIPALLSRYGGDFLRWLIENGVQVTRDVTPKPTIMGDTRIKPDARTRVTVPSK